MNEAYNWSVDFFDDFKKQWMLFWKQIHKKNKSNKQGTSEMYLKGKLDSLDLDQVKSISKNLSENRKWVHQKMESINFEIEKIMRRLEVLKLLGAGSKQAVEKISLLTDQGQELNNELEKINRKMKMIRSQEERLRKTNSI